MNNATSDLQRLALLIDADNISARYLPVILNEIPRYGIATYRRIYGDFTDPQAAKWRTQLLDNSITPIQQFSNVKSHKPGEKAGKNATDSTLIIDAMDILYAGKVDGFIIVSSDSDFTRLAARLRESNMTVIGMGRNHTSNSFRRACTKFVNIDSLYSLDQPDVMEGDEESGIPADTTVRTQLASTVTVEEVTSVISAIIRENDNAGRSTTLSAVGASLNNKFPDFDVRSFGYTQLSKFVEEMDAFEIHKQGRICEVELADTKVLAAKVTDFVNRELEHSPQRTMELAELAILIHESFPSFNYKDVGYSQFQKFIESIPGVRVTGDTYKTVTLS